jgi:hypothetical protein
MAALPLSVDLIFIVTPSHYTRAVPSVIPCSPSVALCSSSMEHTIEIQTRLSSFYCLTERCIVDHEILLKRRPCIWAMGWGLTGLSLTRSYVFRKVVKQTAGPACLLTWAKRCSGWSAARRSRMSASKLSTRMRLIRLPTIDRGCLCSNWVSWSGWRRRQWSTRRLRIRLRYNALTRLNVRDVEFCEDLKRSSAGYGMPLIIRVEQCWPMFWAVVKMKPFYS